MSKGQILKVKIGHDANCSSGMITMVFLLYGSGVYLLLSFITSVVCAVIRTIKLKTHRKKDKVHILYWIIPQILGLGLTAFLGCVAFADNAAVLTVGALAMNIFLALSTVIGYILMQRIKHPVLLIGTTLLVPLIFAIFLVVSLQIFFGTWLWDIFLV